MPSTLLSRRDLDFLLLRLAAGVRAGRAPPLRRALPGDLRRRPGPRRAGRHRALRHRTTGPPTSPNRTFDGQRVRLIPQVRAALDSFAETGLLSAGLDAAVGGMQLPHAVAAACFAWFQAANVATSAYPFLTLGNANLLLTHGSAEQIDTYVRPMLEGRFFGTMCLSEPQAGSSLADITTRAEPAGGRHATGSSAPRCGSPAATTSWPRTSSTWCWPRIPGGAARGQGHLAVHRAEGAGRRRTARSASATTWCWPASTTRWATAAPPTPCSTSATARTPPAAAPARSVTWSAQPHQGLAQMFHMMNEARIGVGAGATALGYTGYLKSPRRTPGERPQGRPVGAKDPAAPQVPIIDHPDVRRMLLAQKSYVEGALALVLYCARLLDEQKTAPAEADRERAHLLLDVLTPITKSWPSQWCLAANDLAIQVLGGYGYTRDYDVEQHYRDNRLNPIHEGTHGIQALDLLGRKVTMHDGAGLALLTETIRDTVDRARKAGGEAAELAGPAGRRGGPDRRGHPPTVGRR